MAKNNKNTPKNSQSDIHIVFDKDPFVSLGYENADAFLEEQERFVKLFKKMGLVPETKGD